MKAVAKELKSEKHTQSQIATWLGVAQNTVSVWLSTNIKDDNSSTPTAATASDCRVKVHPKAKPVIAIHYISLAGKD